MSQLVGQRVFPQISSLDRKLLRELWENRGASLAIVAVIAAGVAVFVMSISTLLFLQHTRDAYFDRYRLADLFASVNRAPEEIAKRLELLPGVARVQTRVVSDVVIQVPGLREPATARMVSLPEAVTNGVGDISRKAGLNAIHLRQGRLPSADAATEVVVSEAFFQANQLQLDSRIEVLLNGRMQPMRVVGVALSPEYVFQIRAGDLLPDDRRFGIFWASRAQLAAAFDMQGAFNDVSLQRMPGVAIEPLIRRVDQVLEPYGCLGAYGRDDQISCRFLEDEIQQLRATGLVVPIIFLFVAAFLLNVVLARRIETQREVIATMKAFGYRDWEIIGHYLKSALLIAVGGGILGGLLGSWLAAGLCQLYSQFFRFPTFVFQPSGRALVGGVMVSLSAAGVAAIFALRRVLRLQPADAMRPAAPEHYRRGLSDALWQALRLPPPLVMILRRLRRKPIVTGLSITGISMATAVLMVSRFSLDAVDHMIDFQFATVQRQDIQVNFSHALSPSAAHAMGNLKGVIAVEPFRAVPIRLRHGHRQRRTGLLGLAPEPELFRLLDHHERPVRLPREGLVLSNKLAELLRVTPGDTIELEVLEERRQRLPITVTAVVTEYTGTNAYIEATALAKLLQEDRRISGAFMTIDSQHIPAVYTALQSTPRVAGVAIKAAALQAIRDTIRESQSIMQGFNRVFAAVIALGVVYNLARITLAEQRRELATLRVIGLTRGEISFMFVGELMLLTALAIPLGWLLGSIFCYSLVKAFESELYRVPLVITRHSLVSAGIGTAAAALASGLWVRRSLDQLDLVAALKE